MPRNAASGVRLTRQATDCMELFILIPLLCLAGPFVAGPFVLYFGLRKLSRLREEAGRLPEARIKDGSIPRPKPGVVKGVLQTMVGALLSMGLGFIIWIINDIATHGLLGETNSKGRLLRIREHTHLPKAARGQAWTDGTVPEVVGIGAWERAVLGQAWLVSARMEHASVAAFGQLSLHLAALGAPPELVARTHLAALDEVRHSQRCDHAPPALDGGHPGRRRREHGLPAQPRRPDRGRGSRGSPARASNRSDGTLRRLVRKAMGSSGVLIRGSGSGVISDTCEV